jgi:hypothetical protein
MRRTLLACLFLLPGCSQPSDSDSDAETSESEGEGGDHTFPGFPGMHCAALDIDTLCEEEPLHKDGERLVRIDPGASFEFAFDGYYWELLTIEDVCLGEPVCPFSVVGCHAGRVIPPGSLLSMNIQPATVCSFEEGECTCPQAESACEIPYAPYNFDGPELSDHLPEASFEFEFTGEPMVIEIG